MSKELFALVEPLREVLPNTISCWKLEISGFGPSAKLGSPAFTAAWVVPLILEKAMKFSGAECAARTILRRIASLRALAVDRLTEFETRVDCIDECATPDQASQQRAGKRTPRPVRHKTPRTTRCN